MLHVSLFQNAAPLIPLGLTGRSWYSDPIALGIFPRWKSRPLAAPSQSAKRTLQRSRTTTNDSFAQRTVANDRSRTTPWRRTGRPTLLNMAERALSDRRDRYPITWRLGGFVCEGLSVLSWNLTSPAHNVYIYIDLKGKAGDDGGAKVT